jgi:hypothetical protein
MNWEMLAAVGQLAAVFIGIPSLIYLVGLSEDFARWINTLLSTKESNENK